MPLSRAPAASASALSDVSEAPQQQRRRQQRQQPHQGGHMDDSLVWVYFSDVWNAIVTDLRERDLLTNEQHTNLKFDKVYNLGITVRRVWRPAAAAAAAAAAHGRA
jgi:hypothetical protein